MTKESDKNGLLIAVEGIDAAGKRTQSLLLSAWLEQERLSCKVLSFPDYKTQIGKEIKSFLGGKRRYTKELKHILFAANRWEKSEEIESLLNKNEVLVVDRYTESNLAYGLAEGLRLDWLLNLEEGLPPADLVILLDAPPTIIRSRRRVSQDTYESNPELQERARTAYRKLAHKFGWKLIDATRDVQDIQKQIRGIVSKKLRESERKRS